MMKWILALACAGVAAGFPLELDPGTANQLEVKPLADGGWELATRGVDPYVAMRAFDGELLPEDHRVLAFEYFCPEGVDGLSVYYGPPFQAGRTFAAGSLGRAESWLPHGVDLHGLSAGKWSRKHPLLRLDFGRKAGVTLRIRGLELRAPNAAERKSEQERSAERRSKLAREERVNGFYQAEMEGGIASVAVESDGILVAGRAPAGGRDWRLLELRPWLSAADHLVVEDGAWLLQTTDGVVDAGPVDGAFEMRVGRMRGERDRISSRWVVAAKQAAGRWKLGCRWRYATDLKRAARHDLDRKTAAGLKGMSGVDPHLPLDDLAELGVKHITINLPVTGLLAAEKRVGWEAFDYGGRRWFANPRLVGGFDKLAVFASSHGMVASGIVLLQFGGNGEMIHPEADRAGHYAMPNLTGAEGVAAYEAALSFLSRRYAQPGDPHGRISNWIVHNEVDCGWEWTNMGAQPAMVFMDSYLRSMRLVHAVTRRDNPHARVFISLTHHWNVDDDPLWHSHPPRSLMERLMESSRVEGDFAWGVAYHPYPQNLRRPDAWNDGHVSDDFDTRLITPKNISVLDRWMRLPEMRDAAGRVRGLLLSEQGFNTPDYSDENQRLQAAGLVYMWRRMRGLESIEAFHNHRWVDHPLEGGLLLGVRKLPADGRPYGAKKFAWHVYQSLDTPAEKQAVRFADGLIGN